MTAPEGQVTQIITRWHEILTRSQISIRQRIKTIELLFDLDLLDFKYERRFYKANLEDLIVAYNALAAVHRRTKKYLKEHK